MILALHDARLAPQAAYEHRFRMLCAMFRAEGYPIGSGLIESGLKQYKQRLVRHPATKILTNSSFYSNTAVVRIMS